MTTATEATIPYEWEDTYDQGWKEAFAHTCWTLISEGFVSLAFSLMSRGMETHETLRTLRQVEWCPNDNLRAVVREWLETLPEKERENWEATLLTDKVTRDLVS